MESMPAKQRVRPYIDVSYTTRNIVLLTRSGDASRLRLHLRPRNRDHASCWNETVLLFWTNEEETGDFRVQRGLQLHPKSSCRHAARSPKPNLCLKPSTLSSGVACHRKVLTSAGLGVTPKIALQSWRLLGNGPVGSYYYLEQSLDIAAAAVPVDRGVAFGMSARHPLEYGIVIRCVTSFCFQDRCSLSS